MKYALALIALLVWWSLVLIRGSRDGARADRTPVEDADATEWGNW